MEPKELQEAIKKGVAEGLAQLVVRFEMAGAPLGQFGSLSVGSSVPQPAPVPEAPAATPAPEPVAVPEADFAKGDSVTVLFASNGKWYKGVVTSDEPTAGKYEVEFAGGKTKKIATDRIAPEGDDERVAIIEAAAKAPAPAATPAAPGEKIDGRKLRKKKYKDNQERREAKEAQRKEMIENIPYNHEQLKAMKYQDRLMLAAALKVENPRAPEEDVIRAILSAQETYQKPNVSTEADSVADDEDDDAEQRAS